MKISDVIDFLEGVKAQDGDLRIESITGFWIREVPSTGERVVVCSVGEGKAIDANTYADTKKFGS